MSIEYTIRPDKRVYSGLLAGFASLARVGRLPRRVLGRLALFILRYARQLLRQRVEDWGKRSGRLSRSLTMHLDDMSVRIGSNLKYARIQQEGGVVKPNGHKYLALPVLPELRRSGVYPRDLPRDSMKFAIADIRIGFYRWRGPALVRAEDTYKIQRRKKKDGSTSQKLRVDRAAGEVMYALVRRAHIRGEEYLVFNHTAARFGIAEIRKEYQEALRAR